MERSDKTWFTGEGNDKPLQYSCLENPMNSIKRQKDWTMKDELPRSVGTQYASGDQWRNNSRKNEVSNAPGKSLQSCLTLCDPIDGSPSLGLSRQEYWSRLPCPLSGIFQTQGITPMSLTLQADSLPSEPPGKPYFS